MKHVFERLTRSRFVSIIKRRTQIYFAKGPLAQLVARLDGIEKVTGSSPVRSTFVLVVQWIEQWRPKPLMQVRLLPRTRIISFRESHKIYNFVPNDKIFLK
jgi:hypothetical protein